MFFRRWARFTGGLDLWGCSEEGAEIIIFNNPTASSSYGQQKKAYYKT